MLSFPAGKASNVTHKMEKTKSCDKSRWTRSGPDPGLLERVCQEMSPDPHFLSQINHLPPTNNYAEQTLRHPVIFRKLIFGNRSAFGAQRLAVNLSVLHTAKCLERDPISLLKTLLLSGAAAAAAILFENSS